jgi:organic hydroperoxide reductase OsmC/OhrA
MAHVFSSHLDWSGAAKGPTRDPGTFSRDLDVSIDGITVPMSSAPGFGGDAHRANPEQLYVVALSACHALTFLFLAARAHVSVTGYSDEAVGELAMVDGAFRMATVTLRPHITLEPGADAGQARALVEKAHQRCFIGNSVSAKVDIEPVIEFAEQGVPS